MSADVLKLLREEIGLLGPSGPARRYPAELRERIVTFVRARVEAGERIRDVCSVVGVPPETLSKWMASMRAAAPAPAQATPAIRPVRVVASRPSAAVRPTFVVRSPKGFGVEGLDFLALIELLRRLG